MGQSVAQTWECTAVFPLGTGGALMWVSEPDGEDKGKFERRKRNEHDNEH
jgi:hypothetical protein